MARNDYYVIAYRILAYLYECLKEGANPDMDYLSPENKTFNINEQYWNYILQHLYEDGYLEGVSVGKVIGMDAPIIKPLKNFMITPKGIDFLQNNTAMSKAKDFLKTLKETVPGL